MMDDDDRGFFRAEIERLTSRLYGTALRLTRNPADAEDLVAKTVAKAWAGLAQLEDRCCFEKWILRILATASRRSWSLLIMMSRPAGRPKEQGHGYRHYTPTVPQRSTRHLRLPRA